MPVIPNFLERLIFLRLNKAPAPFLDLMQAGIFRAVDAALRLGVFDALSGNAKTAAELAHQINADERGTAVLLGFLAASGYVKKDRGRYANTAMAAKWLEKGSPTDITAFLGFWQSIVFPFWDTHLEESVRRGRLSATLYEWLDQNPKGWKDVQEGFIVLARLIGPEILSKVKLPTGARHLLDVGGGHGMYSIQFCRQYPGINATVFDKSGPLAVARETIAAEKMTGKVSVREGDYTRDDLGTGNDVILLFNIIHGNTPEENIELFQKVARSLNPHGLVVIMEQLAGAPSGNAAKAIVQFLGLNFLAALGGQTYEYRDVSKWLSSANFSQLKHVSLRRAPGVSLVLATKSN